MRTLPIQRINFSSKINSINVGKLVGISEFVAG
jgi:hypothetical protein